MTSVLISIIYDRYLLQRLARKWFLGAGRWPEACSNHFAHHPCMMRPLWDMWCGSAIACDTSKSNALSSGECLGYAERRQAFAMRSFENKDRAAFQLESTTHASTPKNPPVASPKSYLAQWKYCRKRCTALAGSERCCISLFLQKQFFPDASPVYPL